MSSIDERVVELQFNNAQFESGVKQSVGTLQKLKSALNLDGAAKGLDGLKNAGKSFTLANVADNVQTVADRFSALGIVGDQVLRRLTNSAINMGKNLLTAIPNQIISGGKRRAQNIEQAKFQLQGLLKDDFDWDVISEDLDYAVSGTAYGLDAAAKAAAQLKASNINFGEDMKSALRGISGVAAMTNSEYEDISHIFTTIAGQGRVMTDQLNQFAGRGLNVAATLAEKFGVTEAELREMVTKGKVDFKTFAEAMNEAFGEQATKANDTFSGALSNVKASLSRMGAQFATPAYDNLRLVLVALIDVFKDVEKFLKPVSAAFTELAEKASGAAVSALQDLHAKFSDILGLGNAKEASSFLTKPMDAIRERVNMAKDALHSQGESLKATTEALSPLEKMFKQVSTNYKTAIAAGKNYRADQKEQFEIEKEKKAAIEASSAAWKNQLNTAKQSLGEAVKSARIFVQSEKDGKKAQEIRQELYEKAAGYATTMRDRFYDLFGIEKQEAEQVEFNAKQYETIEELAKDVILGKYGNGAERKKALEEIGLSYAIIQNKVNELLGVEKRHEVSAEDEAKMAKYFGEAVGEAGEEVKKTETTLTKSINALAGIGAALGIIKNFTSALFSKLIIPFLSWGIPKVLHAILTPLSAIGKRLVDLNAKITESDFFNVKFQAIADGFRTVKNRIVEFISKANALEGIKKLRDTFSKLQSVLSTLWEKGLGRVSEFFSSLGGSIELPAMESLLDLLDAVASKVSDIIDFATSHLPDVASFFGNIVSVVGNLISGLKLLWDTGGGFKGIWSGLQPVINFLKSVGEAFGSFWASFRDGGFSISSLFKAAGEDGKTAFGKLFENISTGFTTMVSKIQTKFKGLIDKIKASAKGQEFLQKWKSTIEGLTGKIKGLIKAVDPIGKISGLVQTIFGGAAAEKVREIATAIGDFFSAFLSGKPADAIKMVGDALRNAFDWIVNGGLLEKLVEIKDAIVEFFTNLFSGKKVDAGKEIIEEILPDKKTITTSLQKIGKSLGSSIKELFLGNTVFASEGGKAVIDSFVSEIEIGEKDLGKFNPLTGVINSIKSGVNKIKELVSGLGGGIFSAFQNFDLGKFGDLIKGGVLVFALMKIIGFVKKIQKLNVSGLLGDISNALKAYTQNTKSDTFIKVAAAIGILATALIALTFVDTKKLYNVVGALSVLIAIVGVLAILHAKVKKVRNVSDSVTTIFEGFGEGIRKGATLAGLGAMILGIAGAVYLIAKAMDTLANVNWSNAEMGVKSLLIILGSLVGAVVLMQIVSKITKAANGVGLAMIGIGVAIGALVLAVKSLSAIDWKADQFHAVIDTLLVLFVGLAAVSAASDGSNGLVKVAAGFLIMSAGLMAFSLAARTFTRIDPGTLAKALTSLAVAFAGLTAAGHFVSKEGGSGFVKLAASLLILVPALMLLAANADMIADGLLVAAGVMVTFGAAALGLSALGLESAFDTLGNNMLKLSAAMLVLGIAAPVLGNGLTILGGIVKNNLGDFVIGFAAISAALAVFGLIAKAINIPVLALGGGFLALAVGIGLLIGLATGFKGFGDLVQGQFGGILAIFNATTGAAKSLAEALGLIPKDVMPTYKTAFESFSTALNSMYFLSDEAKAELGKQIEAIGSLDGSEYTVAIENVMAYIDSLGLEERERRVLIEQVIKELEGDASEKHTVAFHDIEVAISGFNIPPEKREELMELIRNLGQTRAGEYTTEVGTVTALIETFEISDEDKEKLTTAVENIALAGATYGTAVKKVDVALDKAEATDEAKQKVHDAIANIGKLLSQGYGEDSSEVQAEIDKINVALSETGAAEWSAEARKELDDLITDAYKTEGALETSVESLNVTLNNLGIDGDVKKQLTDKITELVNLASNGQNDGEEYYVTYHAAVQLLIDQGVDETKARELLANYSIQAGDALTAKFTAIQVVLDNATFADVDESGFSKERENLKNQVEEMIKLDGVDLQAAIDQFLLDLSNSSIDGASQAAIAEMGTQAGNIFAAAYNDELSGVLEQVEKLRRASYIGSFTVDADTGQFITNKSTLAKEIKSVFKGAEEATDMAILDFAKHIQDEHYTIEEIIASFGNMGMTDQELAQLLFPAGEEAGIDVQAFVELITPLIQSYVTGASETFKEELEKVGGLDFSKYFYPDGQESTAEQRRAFKALIDDDIKFIRESLDLHEADKLTGEMFMNYMNSLSEFEVSQFGPQFQEVWRRIQEGIQQGMEEGLDEEAIMTELYTFLENSLYKTGAGDGINTGDAAATMAEAVEETITTGVEKGAEAAEANIEKQDVLGGLLNKFLGGDKEAEAEIKLGVDTGEIDLDDIKSTLLSDFTFDLPAGVDVDSLVSAITGAFGLSEVSSAATEAGGEAGLNWDQGAANGLTDNIGILEDAMGAVGLAGIDKLMFVWDEHSPSEVAKGLGLYFVQGLANGINEAEVILTAVITRVASLAISKLEEYYKKFNFVGITAATEYINGINSMQDGARSAGSSLGASAESGVGDRTSAAYNLGLDFGEGYIRGVEAKKDEAYSAGYSLGLAAKAGMQEAQNSNSPSKVAMSLGNDFGMGYILGISQFGKKASSAAGDIARNAVDALRTPMGIVRDLLSGDLDVDPVIRPVMDLSDIQNGVKTINGMTPAMGVSLGTISGSMNNRVQTTNADVVSAIGALSRQMGSTTGDTYVIDGITYDDGSNITEAVQSLIRAARVERRR